MNKKKAGIISVIAVLIAAAVVVMTVTDKGSGLQVEEIPVNIVNVIEILSPDNPVIVMSGETDKITLSIMRNYRKSEEVSYSLENGILLVNVIQPSSYFDLSLNPDRLNEVYLEITIPASADITTLKITTDDRDIRLVGMHGTIDAQTQTGQITGQIDNFNKGNPMITLSSDSGNIIIE